MGQYVLAGDLGGTNLRVAAVDPGGRILFRAEAETPRYHDETKIVGTAAELARRCRFQFDSDPLSFGFAIPAIMDAEAGRIFTSPNLPELNGSQLAESLENELNVEVALENDANAAAIGEHWLGASRGFDSSICVTLGTGVGGGIIIEGRLRRGPDGTAGEVGHICIEPLGRECGCGSNGCLEQYASASAIVRMAREILPEFPDSPLTGKDEFDASTLYDLGSRGDQLCIEVFRSVGEYLGIAFSGLINVLNPEVIVIGGGASAGWDLFIEPLRDEIRKRAFREPAERARIVRALLGGDAGVAGAAHLAFARAGVSDVLKPNSFNT